MNNIFFESPVLWSQIDANMHLRHSAYADFGAQARLELLKQAGLSLDVITGLHIGPVLFREELVYLREIHADDRVKVTVELTKCRADGSRWSFRQEIYRGDGIKSAIISVDGAWIDLSRRKLTGLPENIVHAFLERTPKSSDFQLEPIRPTMSQSTLFQQAQEDSKNLRQRPDNETLLKIYALYKQGTVGDAPSESPANPFDIVAKAKFEAWASLKGTSPEAAQEQYVTLINALKAQN